MRLITLMALLTMALMTGAWKNRSDCERFKGAFGAWAMKRNGAMTAKQADGLAVALWAGSGGRPLTACYLAGIAFCETSLCIRKHQPWVKQNKDYLGAKNEVLFSELKAQGLLDKWRVKGVPRGTRAWTDEARAWLDFFSRNPDVGTMLAGMWFCRILRDHGGVYERAVRVWKHGEAASRTPNREVQSLEYWHNVKVHAMDLYSMYRR